MEPQFLLELSILPPRMERPPEADDPFAPLVEYGHNISRVMSLRRPGSLFDIRMECRFVPLECQMSRVRAGANQPTNVLGLLHFRLGSPASLKAGTPCPAR